MNKYVLNCDCVFICLSSVNKLLWLSVTHDTLHVFRLNRSENELAGCITYCYSHNTEHYTVSMVPWVYRSVVGEKICHQKLSFPLYAKGQRKVPCADS